VREAPSPWEPPGKGKGEGRQRVEIGKRLGKAWPRVPGTPITDSRGLTSVCSVSAPSALAPSAGSWPLRLGSGGLASCARDSNHTQPWAADVCSVCSHPQQVPGPCGRPPADATAAHSHGSVRGGAEGV